MLLFYSTVLSQKVAYQLSVEYNLKHPQTFDEKSMAGPDCILFSGLLKKQRDLEHYSRVIEKSSIQV